MSQIDADNWFVAQLKPQGLKKAELNLTRQGFESFCPKRVESAVKRGQRRLKDVPLFPGYLFVQFDPEDRRWSAINATLGISRLILTNTRNPSPLPAPFMAGLMARCDVNGFVGAPPDLAVGDTIRVLSGPFAETIANIEKLDDGERISILMDLMGRETRISVPRSKVEKM